MLWTFDIYKKCYDLTWVANQPKLNQTLWLRPLTFTTTNQIISVCGSSASEKKQLYLICNFYPIRDEMLFMRRCTDWTMWWWWNTGQPLLAGNRLWNVSWWRDVLLSFYFTMAHVVSCLLEVLPAALPTCQCITAKLTHASVLLSSPTQGNSGALYLMRLVWCFSDMPSCWHHYTHSYSRALCSRCPISYFNVRSIFIPRKDTFH